jgi:hypothetical protein
MRHRFVIASELPASPRTIWRSISTMRGINAELAPLVRMTHPKAIDRLDPAVLPIGRRAFRSWLLLFGVFPFDYDDITIVELAPERGFFESSSMLTQRVWQHRRTLQPTAGGCIVADDVAFVPRLAPLGWMFQALFTLAFILRHRNLRRILEGSGTAPRS